MRLHLFPSLPLATLIVALAPSALAQTGTEAPPPPGPAAPAPGPAPETAPAYAPPTAAETAAAPNDTSPLAKDGHPLAGYHGLWYMRDYNDNFDFYMSGRAQIDTYTYMGPGIGSTNLKPTMFLRRVRPEVAGEIMHKWWFYIAGEFAPTALDNGNGPSQEQFAANPGATPTATTARYLSPQTSAVKATPADVFMVWKGHDLFHLQAGQFDLPFTMENRTSDKYFEFIERPLAVRAVGVPLNKDIGLMAWGWGDKRLFHYSLGVVNGAGQSRLSTDGRPEAVGRAFVRPLAGSSDPALKNLQVGASFRAGSHDNHWTFYDYPQMTTQGNWPFWKPTYAGTNGFTHVIPSGSQYAFAGELRLPVSIFDLQGEFVYINNQTREALDGFQATNTERFGSIHGYSYYAQIGFWPLGNRDINGLPGDEDLPHLNWAKAEKEIPDQALQLLIKWEQVALTYESATRGGAIDPKGIDGDIKVNAFSFGANYWATKRIRLSADYVLNMFPNAGPATQTKGEATGPTWTSANRAQAPGNTIPSGLNDSARDTANLLHEVIFRVAAAL
jgi:phosphate-selective porin